MLKRKDRVVFAGLLAIAFFSTAANAQTHLMQPSVSEHVMLRSDYLAGSNFCMTISFKNRAFYRVFPNGVQSTTPFEVPEDASLVVTDVEWSAYGGPNGSNPLQPGNTLRMTLAVVSPNPTGPPIGAEVFMSRGVTLDPDSYSGRPGTSEQLTSGFVVGPGATVCPYSYQEAPSSVAAVYLDKVFLRGYLTR